jgi:hypothetical protein
MSTQTNATFDSRLATSATTKAPVKKKSLARLFFDAWLLAYSNNGVLVRYL